MKQTLDEQDILRKYLLHDLAEAEQERVEERLLTDKEFSRRMALAQDDLLDDFAAGVLSEQETERCRTHFLTTPARLQKLKFAMALDRYVAREEALAPPPGLVEKALAFFRMHPLKAASSMAVVLLVFGAALLAVLRFAGFQIGHDPLQELARVNREQTTDSTPLSELRRSSAHTPTLSLQPNLVREDVEPRTVEITSGVLLVRLLLEVTASPHERFRAVLQTADGDEIAPVENLKARNEEGAQFVVVYVPRELLSRGDFQLRLFGMSGDGRAVDLGLYPFRVTTR